MGLTGIQIQTSFSNAFYSLELYVLFPYTAYIALTISYSQNGSNYSHFIYGKKSEERESQVKI